VTGVVTRRASDRERGAATVLAVALLGVLLLVGSALGVVGAVLAAHRTAQAAADLAALAGAGAAGRSADACGAAAATATANGARLTGCVVEGRDVRVTVAIEGPSWRGIDTGELLAESRAGPG
jgi:secretion/DNA translocation related TadE-like protein